MGTPPFAGADIMTRFAPAVRCFSASSFLVKSPVHSRAISHDFSFHLRFAGSRSLITGIFLPFMDKKSSPEDTAPSNLPCAESYLNRCAMRSVEIKSLMPTHSISSMELMILSVSLPILPKPLMPIFNAIKASRFIDFHCD